MMALLLDRGEGVTIDQDSSTRKTRAKTILTGFCNRRFDIGLAFAKLRASR